MKNKVKVIVFLFYFPNCHILQNQTSRVLSPNSDLKQGNTDKGLPYPLAQVTAPEAGLVGSRKQLGRAGAAGSGLLD